MELAKSMQEKDRYDKLDNDDTSAEDQKSVTEVRIFKEHTKMSQVRT